MGEKRRKSGEAGLSLISDMLKALSYTQDFGCREITSDFSGFEKVVKKKQKEVTFFTASVQKEKQLQREKVSSSSLVQIGMVAVCLGVWLFTCKNIQATAL